MPEAGYRRSTRLVAPPHGWQLLTFPCQRCFNLHCACVTARAEVELLLKRVSERHKASVKRAARTDHHRRLAAERWGDVAS